MNAMDAQSKLFRDVLDEIKQMQHRHAGVLAIAGEVPHEVMLRLQEEHCRLFARLKEIVDKVIGGFAEDDPDREKAAFYYRSVQDLLEGEKALHMTASRRKDSLAQRLKKLRCGKKNLLGYRSAAIGSARPRYLSSKT